MSLETKKEYCVYCHISPEGKKYFGFTGQKPYYKRWRYGHQYKQNFPEFWADIKKYGWNSFEHIIIEENLTRKEAINKERELIFQALKDAKCYNKNCQTVEIEINKQKEIRLFACYIEFFLHLLDSHQKSYKTNINGHRSYKK